MPFGFGGGGGFGTGAFGGPGSHTPAVFPHVRLLPLRSGHVIFCRQARAAPHISGTHLAQLLSIGTLFPEFGSMLLDCIAVRVGVHYEIPASAFVFTSQDGTFIAVNDIAFSGGDLVPSGLGAGTLVEIEINTDPCPTSVFITDDPV